MDTTTSRIIDVQVRTAPFSTSTWLDSQRISTPMGWFPDHAERRDSWRGPGADLVWVMITTDNPDVFGIGQARGGKVTAALIEHHLKGLLLGTDPTTIMRRTAELHRAVLPYAAGGISAMGVGACELALWDLTARSMDIPLYRLLGGEDKPLAYYLTCPDIGTLKELPDELLDGAAAVKVPVPFGPADGRRRLTDNLAVVSTVRELLPDHVGVAVDCFMSWDVPYTVAFGARASELGLSWIEEPLLPDDFEGYAELRPRLNGIQVAGGEHLFSLRDGLRFLAGDCVDVLQVDVTWCGGLTTAATLEKVASARGTTFAPHAAAAQPWAVHLLAASGPGAIAEIMVGLHAEVDVPRPKSSPGVGIEPSHAGF